MNMLNMARKEIYLRRKELEEQKNLILERLKRDEEYLKTINDIGGLEFDLVKKEFFGEDAAEEKAELNILYERRDARMEQLTSDALLLKKEYVCDKCRDTGYLADGKICDCLKDTLIRLTTERYPQLITAPKDFLCVNYTIYGAQEDGAKRCGAFLRAFVNGEEDKAYAVITGALGSGKTYLAHTALNYALSLGKTAACYGAVSLNKLFLSYHLADMDDKDKIWEDFIDPDVLLIDDLGVEQLFNNVSLPYLYELIEQRYFKKTIITTNFNYSLIANKYGNRIFSRLMDKRKSQYITLSGQDLRIKQ